MKFDKKQAVRTVIRCGKEYKRKLAYSKLLFIYRDRSTNLLESVEIVFQPSNYQHLTGVLLIDSNGNVKTHCSMEFYQKCNNNNLTVDEIGFKSDGTTDLKLSALSGLMDISKMTRIIGDYDHSSKNWLDADIIVGGTNYCLAASKKEDTEEYFPRSGLLEDIRDITKVSSQVLAIFQKSISDTGPYREIKYTAKGIQISKINFPENIRSKIDTSVSNKQDSLL